MLSIDKLQNAAETYYREWYSLSGSETQQRATATKSLTPGDATFRKPNNKSSKALYMDVMDRPFHLTHAKPVAIKDQIIMGVDLSVDSHRL